MALAKRGKTWHTHFFVDGQRFRQSLDTSDWREAQRLEKELIAQAGQGKLSVGRQFARLSFGEAVERYLADRKARVGTASQRSESDHAKPLTAHFGSLVVGKLNAELVLAYIRARKEAKVSNTTINMELGILRRVLKRAKRWHLIADDVPRLPERRDIGRALAPDEKLRLLKLAKSRPEWETAYLAAVLALNTTMRGCEIKGLRWRDIDLLDRSLTIRRSKTRAGERMIPLNGNAYQALLRLRERATQLFKTQPEPDWHVFPHSEGYCKPDPLRPMSGWRSAWRNITRAVQCPQCGEIQSPAQKCAKGGCNADIKELRSSLHGLRFHDLRHHAITELAESQTSDQTTMAIAGHVSPKMLAHYSHVRVEAKRKALDGLATVRIEGKQGGYDTSHDTKPPEVGAGVLQAIEKNGGDDETRTRDLCRDRAAF
jgi:integrase